MTDKKDLIESPLLNRYMGMLLDVAKRRGSICFTKPIDVPSITAIKGIVEAYPGLISEQKTTPPLDDDLAEKIDRLFKYDEKTMDSLPRLRELLQTRQPVADISMFYDSSKEIDMQSAVVSGKSNADLQKISDKAKAEIRKLLQSRQPICPVFKDYERYGKKNIIAFSGLCSYCKNKECEYHD